MKYRLTHKRLCEVLSYDRRSGIFRLRKPTSVHDRRKIGDALGALMTKGYMAIMLDGERIPNHVLAWFYVTGRWPTEQIDHKDLDKVNNAFANLREATNGQNKANSRVYKNTKSGLKGAYFSRGAWVAKIRKDNKLRHIGTFRDAKSAHAAYVQAAKRLHGDFARAG
jgi:hypothetical protein